MPAAASSPTPGTRACRATHARLDLTRGAHATPASATLGAIRAAGLLLPAATREVAGRLADLLRLQRWQLCELES